MPALCCGAPRDPVFTERYLGDLRDRLPHADVQRYEGQPTWSPRTCRRPPSTIWRWVADRDRADQPDRGQPRRSRTGAPAPAAPWAAQQARAGDSAAAVAERAPTARSPGCPSPSSRTGSPSWPPAAAAGVRPGRPGRAAGPARAPTSPPRSTPAGGPARSSWSPTPGSGLRGLGRALRGAGPDHVIGIRAALLAARRSACPGGGSPAGPIARVGCSGVGRGRAGRAQPAAAGVPTADRPDAEAAVLFTSGATGPAKGVVYRTAQLPRPARAWSRRPTG